MELLNAIQILELLKQVDPSPNVIFIHCWCNDLARTSVRTRDDCETLTPPPLKTLNLTRYVYDKST